LRNNEGKQISQWMISGMTEDVFQSQQKSSDIVQKREDLCSQSSDLDPSSSTSGKAKENRYFLQSKKLLL